MCGYSDAAIEKSGQEPVDEHRNGDLGTAVIHAPDTDARLGQIRVHLNKVSFAESQ